MLQDIHMRYKNGCMGLYTQDDNDLLVFVGTAFVVHPDGYLLTVAHAIPPERELFVVPAKSDGDFQSMDHKAFRAIPVRVAQQDFEHDLALLVFADDVEINMPDHVVGVPETVGIGTGVACLGFPLGFQCIYNQMLQQGVVSAKILSTNDTRVILFDSRVHDGSRGGLLINMEDQRVIGVVSDRFDSFEASPVTENEPKMPTCFSYAVSIEHALPLMEKEGLEVF